MEKLPEDFKKKWIAALRSGEYKQCTGFLHLGGGHCCLGVAEIIHGVKSESTRVLRGNFPQAIEGISEMSTKLTSMNDNGNTFSQIADYIEENL